MEAPPRPHPLIALHTPLSSQSRRWFKGNASKKVKIAPYNSLCCKSAISKEVEVFGQSDFQIREISSNFEASLGPANTET